ncbi:hypothetical protein CDD83_10360 [Cordyceps sp. RAO-2017]|nr:hypothetical protein CDD83_10360 [Cordyceps sp. RAO-2017]
MQQKREAGGTARSAPPAVRTCAPFARAHGPDSCLSVRLLSVPWMADRQQAGGQDGMDEWTQASNRNGGGPTYMHPSGRRRGRHGYQHEMFALLATGLDAACESANHASLLGCDP